ncbi:hypothetical protein U91I_02786 [alpha proteobacterium U9-1i]|nr:hypothetical protein U91I_02786 [alpha proteobacterium U9-1i]
MKSQGWDSTLAAIESGEPLSDDVVAKLKTALDDHILYGEKLVRFYELTESEAAVLRKRIQSEEITSGLISDRFPLLLPQNELEKHEFLDPVPVGRIIRDEDTALVFGAARRTTFRVPLDIEFVPVEARDYFSGYSELVGIRDVRLQTLDVISVHTTKPVVEVRCDFPEGMTGEALAVSIAHAHNFISETIGEERDALNLFEAMGKMFRAKDEGTVVEAAFTTQTASIKHERMRRRRYSLREEPYHMAGREAVQDALEVFKLAIRWDVEVQEGLVTIPEAFFSSTVKMLSGKTPPVLYDVTISGCLSKVDFEYARSRILAYV